MSIYYNRYLCQCADGHASLLVNIIVTILSRCLLKLSIKRLKYLSSSVSITHMSSELSQQG